MMMLLAVGAALLVFGAVVLLRYSDKPGGTIKALGAEISSTGAGLPLIALGVGCIGYAATHWPSGPTPAIATQRDTTHAAEAAKDSSCIGALLAKASADRVDTVEVGMQGVEIIPATERLDLPFVVVVSENGAPVGAVRVRLYKAGDSSADLYKVEDAADIACTPNIAPKNASRGGNPRELMNWDTMRIAFGAHQYDLRIGGTTSITLTVSRGP